MPSEPGVWWRKMFGRRRVAFRVFEHAATCCASDDGERCTARGQCVVAFTVSGTVGISTVCERHMQKFRDEARACGCIEQSMERTESLPFEEVGEPEASEGPDRG